MKLPIVVILAALSFVVYEGVKVSQGIQRATEEAQKLTEGIKKNEEAVKRWAAVQDQIHKDQMLLLERIERLERESDGP